MLKTTANVAVLLAIVGATATLVARQGTVDEQIDITVIGKNNVPVKDLTVADVTVAEDNVVREVVRVAPDDRPLAVAWLTQNVPPASAPQTPAGQHVTSEGARLAKLKTDAQAAVVRLLAASSGSRLSFVAWADPPLIQAGFSSDAATAIKTAEGLHLPMFSFDPSSGMSSPDVANIVNACRAFVEMQEPRPVVLVDDGFPDETLAPRVEDALKASHASLWVITSNVDTDPGRSEDSGTRSEMPYILRKMSLGVTAAANVAIASGGWRLEPSKDVTVDTLATLIAAQQLVTYRRPSSSGPPAKLSVTVSRKDIKVAAPTWPPK